MPKEYQPIEYYLEKIGNPKSYQELLEDYAIVLARLRSYEQTTEAAKTPPDIAVQYIIKSNPRKS